MGLAALKADLQRPNADDQERQSLPVHVVGHVDVVGGLRHVAPGQHAGQDPERQVDVEDPGPGVVVGDPSAERRPEGRADHDAHAEDGHGGAGFLAREDVEEDRLRGGDQRAAADALDHAPEHQVVQRGGVAAEERGQGEEGDGPGVVVAAAEPFGEPAGERQDDDVGHDIAGADPRDFVQRGAEIPHHVRDGHVDDAGVHQLEDARQRDREGDQVARAVHLGAGELRPPTAGQGNGGHGEVSGS